MADPTGIVWDSETQPTGIVWDSEKPERTPFSYAKQAASYLAPQLTHAKDFQKGLTDLLYGGAQLAAHGLESAAPAGSGLERYAQEKRQNIEQNLAASNAAYAATDPANRSGSSTWQALGSGVAMTPFFTAIPAAGTVLGRAAQAIPMGAAGAAVSPVDTASTPDFGAEKAKQVGMGAALGPVTSLGFDAASRVLSPASQKIRQLITEGVNLTPGQALGGFAKSVEDKLTSIPVLGDMIQASRGRSLDQFNQAMYVRAASEVEPFMPGSVKAVQSAEVGHKGIDATHRALSAAYDDALSRSVPSPITPEFTAQMDQLESMLPTSRQADFRNAVQRYVFGKVTPGGTITPSVAKDAESGLGQLYANYKGSQDGDQRLLASGYQQAQANLRELMAANNPETAPQIQAANRGWTTLVQIENAGRAALRKESVFSPSQYISAIGRGDTSIRDNRSVRGLMPNQGFVDLANSVLPSQYPDSGTIGRYLLAKAASLPLMGPAGYAFPTTTAVATGLGSLAYTPPIQKMITGILTARPEALRKLAPYLQDVAPYAGGVGIAPGLLSGGGQ